MSVPWNQVMSAAFTTLAQRSDVRGFADYTQAYNITRNMARGLATPFWLVQDRGGIYHFVRILGQDLRLASARESIRIHQRETFNYLGVTVVAEFNANGDEVK